VLIQFSLGELGAQPMMGGTSDRARSLVFTSFRSNVMCPSRMRSIERFVELDGLRRELATFYRAIGRPPVDPELMIPMLIVGYCFGIRLEPQVASAPTP
jgi:hypothetical protein